MLRISQKIIDRLFRISELIEEGQDQEVTYYLTFQVVLWIDIFIENNNSKFKILQQGIINLIPFDYK